MKPILFNTEMVRAIIGGIKAQSRRPVKWDISNNFDIDAKGSAVAYINPETGDSYAPVEAYKYQKGDTLWVRETWQTGYNPDDMGEDGNIPLGYCYRASGDNISSEFSLGKWRPSIHMPKKAARIFLQVANIRVERLQEIKYLDLVAEGVSYEHSECDLRERFEDIWDSIYYNPYKMEYIWDCNPWVFVIEFKRK